MAESIEILREETDASYDDIRLSSVARRERWKQLMKRYYGKIDAEIAKQMLGDHYDVYLKRDYPSIRTICGHGELDDGRVPGSSRPYRPGGAVDGKVVDRTWLRTGQCGQKGEAPAILVSMRKSSLKIILSTIGRRIT